MSRYAIGHLGFDTQTQCSLLFSGNDQTPLTPHLPCYRLSNPFIASLTVIHEQRRLLQLTQNKT